MSTTSFANWFRSRGRFAMSHYPAARTGAQWLWDFKLRHYRSLKLEIVKEMALPSFEEWTEANPQSALLNETEVESRLPADCGVSNRKWKGP